MEMKRRLGKEFYLTIDTDNSKFPRIKLERRGKVIKLISKQFFPLKKRMGALKLSLKKKEEVEFDLSNCNL